MENNNGKNSKKITKKKKIVIVCVLVAVILGSYAVWSTPKLVFLRKFHFALPASSQTEKSDYSIIDDSFSMKIKLDKNDVEKVESELRGYYHDKGLVSDVGIIPHYENTVKWWDMKENEIIYAHFLFKDGRFADTALLFSFIANKNGQYYLYVNQCE